jgi:hypothetical protein
VLFETRLELAKGARLESLPLPLAEALYVTCGDGDGLPVKRSPSGARYPAGVDIVTNGTTRAINDDAMLTGACRLHYDPRRVLRVLEVRDRERGADLLKFYGRQNVKVTLRRAGATEQMTTWSLDPARANSIPLPALTEDDNASGIYTVIASVNGPIPPSVQFRPPRGAARGVESTSTALGDLEFRANLRPRGRFGWQVLPIRAFMTFPLNFTGIRFPADPSRLRSSSQNTFAQATQLQLGTVVAIEPWNYDSGRNPLPIPTRFATGFHLYDISDGEFTPAFVLGATIVLPIVDLPKGVAEDQLGTDAALGLFWEVDLQEESPFAYGNHFLVTLGLNVFSLFGAK